MGRLLAWIGVLLLALYLVFLGGGWLGIYATQIRLTSVVLIAIALGSWAVVAWRRPAWRPRSALLPAIVLAIGSLALSTIASRHPRQSVEYLGYAILLAALYLLLVRLLANPFFRARVATLVVACAFVLGGAYVVMNVAHWVTFWGLVGRVTVPPLRPEDESLTYGNPSAVLTIVVLFACSATAAIGLGTIRRWLVVGVLAALSLFAIIVSGSRAGWFAVGLTVVAAGALYVADAGRRGQARQWVADHVADRRARVAVAGLAVLGLVLVAVLFPTLVRRLTTQGVDLRFNYLLAAERMFVEAPILGVGPGGWVIEHIRYTLGAETLYFIPHAHDIYAQTAAELGIVGIAAGIFLIASLVVLVRDGLRDPDAVRRRWGWAAAIALIYFALHQLLDFYPNMAAVLFAAAVPVAWLDATATEPIRLGARRLPDGLGRLGSVAGLVAVAVACAGMILTEVPATAAASASDLANDGKWAEADSAARSAVASDPTWAPYQLTMGLTAANLGDDARAAAAFRAAAESDDLPEAWLDLAAEEHLLGQDRAAASDLSRAARLGLQRPAIAIAIGDLAQRLGDTDLARRGFTAAIAAIPSLAGDPWWQADPTRAALFPGLVDAAIAAADPANRWEIALMAGDISRARSLEPAGGIIEGSLTADDVIAAWTGDDAAFGRVLAAASASPLGVLANSWAARLEGRRDDPVAQNRYLHWAFEIGGGGGTEIRVSDHQMLGRTAQGTVAEFWGTYTYRRPTPWNPLVPSLVQLTLR